MRIVLSLALLFTLLQACTTKSGVQRFEIKGSIKNNPGKKIYLEEIPMATMKPMTVDSMEIGKDGSYKLKTAAAESRVYNLRIDQSQYPIAAVVNDENSITLDAVFSKENNQFVESYDVKGSPVSQQLKDYMTGFNSRLQSVFSLARRADTLRQLNAPDSLYAPLNEEGMAISGELKKFTTDLFAKSNNPALTMLVLGYYQSTANNTGLGLQPISNEEVTSVVNDLAKKYPKHQGVASIKSMLEQQNAKPVSMVGQTAPEITLPDPEGKEIKLSSFRGKYVLVDFWASWCKPCRLENPTVVKAFNRFKDKNFTVLGVSLDRPGEKDAWTAAIKADKLTWTHVSDLQFWKSVVVPLYGIQGIPFNVLVDPDGKIIAQELRGSQLEATLAELLK